VVVVVAACSGDPDGVLQGQPQQILTSVGEASVDEGAQISFVVELREQPLGPITIAVSASLGAVSVEPTELTFDARTYRVAQQVTVRAASDANTIDELVHVQLAGMDAEADIAVAVIDDDVQGLVLDTDTLPLIEGDVATLSVSLAFEPSGTATVTFSPSDHTAVQVDAPSSLVFDSTNYGVPQLVTFRAVEDADRLPEEVTVMLGGAASRTVTVMVADNDEIIAPSDLLVYEGSSADLTVALANDPGPSGRLVAVEAIDGDVALATTMLSFTSANYATGLQLGVQGLIDATSNHAKMGTVRLSSPGQESRDITVTILDQVPGTAQATCASESPYAGTVGWMKFSFMPDNPWPGDGRLVIMFPAGYDASAATLGTSNLDGTLSLVATTTTITVTRMNGTEIVNGNQATLRLDGIRRPGVSGTYLIDLETRTSGGQLIDTASPGDLIFGNVLTAVSAALGSTQPGATTTATLSVTTTNPWPTDGRLKVYVPAVFGVAGASVSSQTGVDGVLTVSVSGSIVTLTRSGGTATPAGSAVTIVLGDIVNPATSQATDGVFLETTSADGARIDTGAPKGFTVGCPASMTKEALDAYNVSRGLQPWLDVFYAADSWGSTAAYVELLATSDYLVAHDFAFTVPAGATIAGLRFDIERDFLGDPAVDSSIKVVKSTIVGTEHATASAWTPFEDIAYGGATDLWGQTWSTSEIESSAFGVAISAQTTGQTAKAKIAHVSATVYLSCP
jgi:hypothetical protein